MTSTLSDESKNLDTAPAPPARPARPASVIALTAIAAVAILTLGALGLVAIVGGDDGDVRVGAGSMMDDTDMMDDADVPDHMGAGGHMSGASSNPTVVGAREIAITASSFSFQPSEIRVRAGEDVTIFLSSTDITHDFTVDALDFHAEARPGRPERAGLRAPSESGTYTVYCSVSGHRQAGMTASFIVEPA